MANKRNTFEIRIHPKEDTDLSSIHSSAYLIVDILAADSAEIDYAERIQLKNKSIREDGRHE